MELSLSSIAGSVVVCTRDRISLLRDCLASLDSQISTSDEFEVVVVDNGSTDGTGHYLADWAAVSPLYRRVVGEPLVGLSRARNAGVANARGHVVLFIDDDAIAPQGWVAAHLRAYDLDPSVDAVGGPVVLSWPHGRPPWATPRLEHWWSALDLGDESRPFPPPHGPYGTNMSVKTSQLKGLDGFSPALGRRRRSLLSGEEAALWSRLWASGGQILYQPAALVVHQVVPHRLTRRWVIRRGLAQGRTNARLQALVERRDKRTVLNSCRVDARQAGTGLGNLVVSAIRGKVDSSDLLNELARRAGHAAAVPEHLRLWLLDVANVDWR